MRRAVAALVALAALPACGLGDKEGYADAVTAAPALAIAEGTVQGSLTASLRIADAPFELTAEQRGQTIAVATEFVADLGAHRSLLAAQQLVHDDLVLHLRRADAEEGDARPWLTLDLDDLHEDAGLPFSNSNPIRMPYTVFAVPPAVLVDLIGGALTGSLEPLDDDTIDDTPVRGYRANFDLEKMLTDTREGDYDERRRDAVERTFETLDIGETIHPGRVWLDGEGRPRRFEVTFDSKPRRHWTFAITVTIDLLQWGVDAAFAPPSQEETIHIASITRLMTELARSFEPPETAALPEGALTPSTTVPSEQPPPEAEVEG